MRWRPRYVWSGALGLASVVAALLLLVFTSIRSAHNSVPILPQASLTFRTDEQRPSPTLTQLELYARVADTSGNEVTLLKPTDLRVMEGGVDAKIVKVEPVKWPVKVQLLLDNGVGLGAGNLQILKDAVKSLIEALPDNLEVTIVTTAPQPRFLVRPTTDKAMMIEGLSGLAADSAAGRLAESIDEATQRIENDKSDHLPVIIISGTSPGDANELDRSIRRMVERMYSTIRRYATPFYIVLLNSTAGSASGGASQTPVGMAFISDNNKTGGRYESITDATRLSTLLPEIGKLVAASHEKPSQQFRLTIVRPAGKSGGLGQIAAGARGGLVVEELSDGRLP